MQEFAKEYDPQERQEGTSVLTVQLATNNQKGEKGFKGDISVLVKCEVS